MLFVLILFCDLDNMNTYLYVCGGIVVVNHDRTVLDGAKMLRSELLAQFES